MGLMFYTLRDYTFPAVEKPFFDDRKIFAFFALGIVLGMVLFAFEEWGSTASSTETLLVLIIGFALMEESMKLMILNFPRFQHKIDTAFYGLSFGLGISATFTFATIYASALGIEDLKAVDMVAYALIGLQFVLLHGATTAYIGIGVARGEVKPYFSEALLIHIGYSLLMVPFFMLDIPELLRLAAFGAAYIVVVYGYVKLHRLSLPVLIQDAKRLAGPKPKKRKR